MNTGFVIFIILLIILILIIWFSHHLFVRNYIRDLKKMNASEKAVFKPVNLVGVSQDLVVPKKEKKPNIMSIMYRELPSLLNPLNSRFFNPVVVGGSTDFSHNDPNSAYQYSSVDSESSSSLSNKLPNYKNLGKVDLAENIKQGDETIYFKNSRNPVSTGMTVSFNGQNYLVTGSDFVGSVYGSVYEVKLDKPVDKNVDKTTSVVLSSGNSSTVITGDSKKTASVSSYYGSSGSTYGPSITNKNISIEQKNKTTYIIHLTQAVSAKSPLRFQPSLNIDKDILSQLSLDVVTTTEPFTTIREGLAFVIYADFTKKFNPTTVELQNITMSRDGTKIFLINKNQLFFSKDIKQNLC